MTFCCGTKPVSFHFVCNSRKRAKVVFIVSSELISSFSSSMICNFILRLFSLSASIIAICLSRASRYTANSSLKRCSSASGVATNVSASPPASMNALRSASTCARCCLYSAILMASTTGRSVCTGSDSIFWAKRATSSLSLIFDRSSPATGAASCSSAVSSPISRPAASAARAASSSANVSLIDGVDSSRGLCSAATSVAHVVVVCVSSALLPTGSVGAVRLIFSVAIAHLF